MTTSSKDLWLGGSYQSEDSYSTVKELMDINFDELEQFLKIGPGKSPTCFSILNEIDTLLLDTFQPGYTYTIPFGSNGTKLAHLLASLINQFKNIYNCENYSDALSLIVVDNELEKKVLSTYLLKLINNLNKRQKIYSYVDKVEELNFCANGLALLTLDELPTFVVKTQLMARSRESELERLSLFIHKVIKENGNRNFTFQELSEENLKELFSLLDAAEVKPVRESMKNLYGLNAHVESMRSFYGSSNNQFTFNLSTIPKGKKEAFLEQFEEERLRKAEKALEKNSKEVKTNKDSKEIKTEGKDSLETQIPLQANENLENQEVLEVQTSQESQENSELVNQEENLKAKEAKVNPKSLDSYKFRTFPLGLVYVYSGYLYSLEDYLPYRRYLLDFFKAFIPFSMVWAEHLHQGKYCALESFRVLPLKNIINVGINEAKEGPYFFYTGKVSGVNRINLESFGKLQDYRRFNSSNGITLNPNNSSLRINPGNNFKKLQSYPVQLIIALAIALQNKKEVLYVVDNLEEAYQELEAIIKDSPNLKACKDNLSLVEAKNLLFYPFGAQIMVIAKDVKLNSHLLAHLCSLAMFVDNQPPMVILGSGENKNTKGQESEIDLSEEQKEQVVDFLRDRRVISRNIERYENNISSNLTDLSRQTTSYFFHQEKRNWNAQLSSEKFLTVRYNNLESSYYPNLNGNPLVLAGFHNHYFDHHLVIDDLVLNPAATTYRFLNLNSGDLITNVSLAIHRIINLFSTRHLKVSSSQHLTAVWLVNDDQKDLIPVYQKLFSNIFSPNKEPNCNVRVSSLEDLKEIQVERENLLDEAKRILKTDSYRKATELLDTNPNKVFDELGDDFNKEELANLLDFLEAKDKGELDKIIFDYRSAECIKAKENYISCILTILRFVFIYNNLLIRHASSQEEKEKAAELEIDLERPLDEVVEAILKFCRNKESSLYQNFANVIQQTKAEGILEQVEEISVFLHSQTNNGLSTLVLATMSDYLESDLVDYGPDLIVVESTYDLFRHETAAKFAEDFIRVALPNHKDLLVSDAKNLPTDVVLVSSPENDSEALLKYVEDIVAVKYANRKQYVLEQRKDSLSDDIIEDIIPTYGPRAPLHNFTLDLSSAERFAYVVDFSEEDFAGKGYQDFTISTEQAKELAVEFLGKNANQLPFVNLNAFTMPLSAYALPRHYNVDYRVNEKEQLPANSEYGYIPALGERNLEIQVNYFPFTKSKVINGALAILLQSKNTKARGLVVVNNPAVKKFFDTISTDFNFVVHDFDTIKLERGVFSHSVIIADPEEYVEQAIIQHTALVTRSFKSTGSIFFLCNANSNKELFALLAQNSPYLSYTSRSLQIEPTIFNSSMKRRDVVSPYFNLCRSPMYKFESIELPVYKAKKKTEPLVMEANLVTTNLISQLMKPKAQEAINRKNVRKNSRKNSRKKR